MQIKSSVSANERLLLAFLCSKINLNIQRLEIILSSYGSIKEAVDDYFFELKSHSLKWLDRFTLKSSLNDELSLFKNKLDTNEIFLLSYEDEIYPKQLRFLEDFPLILYYQGNLEVLEKKEIITVVGSRNYTKYAEIILNNILKPACRQGIGVVSGLAIGVDSLAHKIAVENNSITLAVIGSGLDNASFYPHSNHGLKKQILAQDGLVISEYPVGVKATIYNFPRRNRILAALSEVTWIVQGSLKSGTLITASFARDLGKVVATTPGSILEESLGGNLRLIKDGANIISEVADIFQLLGLKSHPEINIQKNVEFSSEFEELVYKKLSLSPQTVDQLGEVLEVTTASIGSTLSILELSGNAINIGQNQWVRG